MQQVELAADAHTLIVDGKIWMREPNWINKATQGKTFGAILTIIGIAGILIAFPICDSVGIHDGFANFYRIIGAQFLVIGGDRV